MSNPVLSGYLDLVFVTVLVYLTVKIKNIEDQLCRHECDEKDDLKDIKDKISKIENNINTINQNIIELAKR